MPDVSQLSDAELMQRLQAPPTPQADVSALSDEELMQRLGASGQSEEPQWSGGVLPVSEGPDGSWQWDSNAGIVGTIKRAVTLPGDVMTGKVDPLSDEAIERSTDLGAIATPMNPAVRSTGAALPGMKSRYQKPKVKPPSSEELKGAAKQGYDAARDMGVDFDPQAVKRLAAEVKTDLEKDGIIAELAPKSFKVLRKLDNPPQGSVAPLAGLDAARKSFKNAARDFTNPTEQLAAKRIIERLDRFMEAPDPAAVVAGPAAAAGRVQSTARKNYAAAKRSEKLQGVETDATRNAAVANSGTNVDNAIRQRARNILKSPKERAGFNKQELDALEKVARGTKNRNVIRFVGKILGGGGGLGSVVAGGAGWAVGGPVGGIGAPVVGWGAREAANRLASRSMGKADELVRKRSPLYEEILRSTPPAPAMPRTGQAGVRSLMTIRPPDQQ